MYVNRPVATVMPPRFPDWYKMFFLTTMWYAVFLPGLYHREKARERAIDGNKNNKGKAS
jgi:hypothetical protein